ncbi:MAG: polysaccharide deacetylase [Gemmatimonadetes bacterium]|nr:polysaccharide deacetylase [Gemmatimonadota bacterium]
MILSRARPDVLFTVDVEPDCPPYLDGWRGVIEGMPRLLEVLAAEDVPATCFTTGETAERFPAHLDRAVAAGHELACHGHTHKRFGLMDEAEARDELARSSSVLRELAQVTAFRAPNLDFPDAYLPLLVEAGYRVDSSEGAHRMDHRARAQRRRLEGRSATVPGLERIPASTTSSVLRLPARLRDPWLAKLRRPVVLFIHPWELVDLRGEKLRWDCRAGTGPRAIEAVREVIRLFKGRGARFGTMRELARETVREQLPESAS